MRKLFLKFGYLLFAMAGAHLLAADAPVVPIIPPPDSEAPPGFYSVTDTETQVELKTPYGTIHIPTGFGANVPYRLSIPVDQLKKGAGPLADLNKSPEKPGDPAKPAEGGPLFPVAKASPGQPASAPQAPTVVIDDADTLVVDANRLFNRRRYYEALTVVDQLLRKRPDFIRGWLMKGSLLLVQGQKELAMKAWRKAQELDPGNPEVQTVLSRYQ